MVSASPIARVSFPRNSLVSLFVSFLIILITSPVRAQTDQTWINGGTLWDLSSLNWDGGAVWGNGNNAIFSGSADTITVGEPVTANHLTFSSSGFVIQSNLLSFAPASIVSVTNAGHLATIQSAIDAGGITKTGNGTLILSGASTFGGNVSVSQGALRVSSAGALGDTTGTTTVSDGARIELSGGVTVAGESLTINGSGGNFFGSLQSVGGSNVWNGNVLIGTNLSRIGAIGSGSVLTISGVVDDGANTFGLAIRNADSGGVTVLSGVNTYKGSTDVVVGTLKLDGGNDRLPVGTTLNIGNTSNVATAAFDLNGRSQQVGVLVSLGTTMDRTVTNTSATESTLTFGGTSSGNYGGVISGNLNLVKSGTGTQILSGANDYSGTTTVNGLALQINHNNALGSTAGGTVVNNIGSARLVLGDGVSISGESLQISGNGDNNGALQTVAGATATWNGDIVLVGSGRVGGGVGGTLILNGGISGSGGILFSRGNDATTVLNGVSTYTGDTQMFANGGTAATLRMGVDNALSPLSQYSTISAAATKAMNLDLNGHVLTLRALDTSARHLNGAFLFILNNGATASTFTVAPGSGSTNFTGILADGSGGLSLVKTGNGTQVLVAANTYTGTTTIEAGTLQIGGAVSTFGSSASLASTSFLLNGGTLALDNLGASNSNANRLADSAVLQFQGGALVFRGSDQVATNSTETVATLEFARDISTVTTAFGSTNTAILTAAQLSRAAGEGIGFINGISLGKDSSSTASVSRLLLSTAPDLVGTSDALAAGINSAARNTKIVPYLVGVSDTGSGGSGTADLVPNTFLTYEAGTGLRPLNPTDEFTSNTIVSGDNIRATASTTTTASSSVNSVVIEGDGVILKVASGHTLTVDSGAILFSAGVGPRIDGPGTLNFGTREGIITINSTGNTFIAAPISGTGGVTYHGAGTLVLSTQQNTYSGDTVLRVASVIPQANSVGPAGSPVSGSFGTGRLILDGSAIRATTGGDITIGNEVVLRADTTIPDTTGAKSLIFTGPVTLEGDGKTLFQNSSAATFFTGAIGDGGGGAGLQIAGNGTGPVVLEGANTYSGGTVVEKGTLLVNNLSGSGTGTGTVTVQSGGILGGTGTIGGETEVQSGAILSAGVPGMSDGVGTLTFEGELTMQSGSTWLVDLVEGVSGTADRVNVGGGLSLTGADLTIQFSGSFEPGKVYTIANYATSLTGTFNGLSDGAFVDPGMQYYISYGALSGPGAITLTAVPEPGTIGILGIALSGILLRRRRRKSL